MLRNIIEKVKATMKSNKRRLLAVLLMQLVVVVVLGVRLNNDVEVAAIGRPAEHRDSQPGSDARSARSGAVVALVRQGESLPAGSRRNACVATATNLHQAGPVRGAQPNTGPEARPGAVTPAWADARPVEPRPANVREGKPAAPTPAVARIGMPAATPSPPGISGDIVDLVEQGKIEVRTRGDSIECVLIDVRRKSPETMTVRVPVGTFMVASDTSSQNMFVTESAVRELRSDQWTTIRVAAACANRSRDIPSGQDGFAVQRAPNQEQLAALIPQLERERVGMAVRQAAVWIVTDNADYDDLGILVSHYGPVHVPGGGTRVIRENDTARAMRICMEAGVDIKARAIWNDRQRVLNGITDDGLRQWLTNMAEMPSSK